MAARLTLEQVRSLHLHAQGVGTPLPVDGDARTLARAAIERMAALQIDTINVVARSPYLVLWSRIGDFEHRVLDGLLSDGEVFEYWSHAACFLPSADFPAYRSLALAGRTLRQKRSIAWLQANQAMADHVVRRITEEGPLRSIDFERSDGSQRSGWWDWKDEKVALETLFAIGRLMVRGRQNFQRIYDLAERVRPDCDENLPTVEQATRGLIARAAKALGVTRPAWIANYLFLGQPQRPLLETMREMVGDGELVEVDVEAWRSPGYAVPGWLEANDPSEAIDTRTTLLSPFDPIVWDRERASELFGFDYRIECYTPAAKRTYGYFTLPILHRGRIVGRLDPKTHRSLGLMEVKALHLEPGVVVDADLADGIAEVLRRFAAWHGTPDLVVRETNPPALKEILGRKAAMPV